MTFAPTWILSWASIADIIININDPINNKSVVPVTMTVVAPVTSTISFNSNSPVKVGNSLVFTNTRDPGHPQATEYLWDFGGGIAETVGTTAPMSHVYATFGEYTVSLKACNVIGCSTYTEDVMVLPKVIFMPLMNKH